MTDPQNGPARGAPARNLATGVLGILAVLALLYVDPMGMESDQRSARVKSPNITWR